MLLKLVRVFVFTGLILTHYTFASSDLAAAAIAQADKPSNQELFAAQHMGQVIDIMRSEAADPIWPGFRLEIPAILTFKTGHLLAFHLNSQDTLWHLLTVNGHISSFSASDKWGVLQSPLNQKFPIENQFAYVFAFDTFERDPFLPFLVFVHERFHQHQFARFKVEQADQAGLKAKMHTYYTDHLNVDNLALMKMEEAVLADFLTALKKHQDKPLKVELLKRFVAVNTFRMRLLTPASADWELLQQQMEGMADYVSIKLLDTCAVIPQFDAISHLQRLLGNYLGDRRVVECAIQWRHYGMGAVLGYALDDLEVAEWKMNMQQMGKAPSVLLAETLQLSEPEIQQLLKEVKSDYQYAEIRNKLDQQLIHYQNEIASFQKQYVEAEGVVVSVATPKGKELSGGGSVAHTFKLENGLSLSLQTSLVVTTEDGLWKLSFERIPLLFQNRWGGHEFKVENSLMVMVDGEAKSLASLLNSEHEKTFHSIAWKGGFSAFSSENLRGTISGKGGKLLISFE